MLPINDAISMIRKNHCYVIMPFSETSKEHTTDYWNTLFSEVIKPKIKKQRYSCTKSTVKPGSIIRAVIKDLAEADIVLAVLTDFNPNVWYELAARHSLKRGTIMMIQEGQKLPFDLAPYGVIEYTDENIRTTYFDDKLKEYIRQLGSGKTPDNPITDYLTQPESNIKNLPLVKSKETYVKLQFLTPKKNKIPAFEGRIRGSRVPVYDCGVYHISTYFNSKPQTYTWHFYCKEGQVDNVMQLSPFKKNVENVYEDDSINHWTCMVREPTANTVVFVVNHYNSFQHGNKGEYEYAATKAEQDTEELKLAVDFSSILTNHDQQNSLFSSPPKAFKNFTEPLPKDNTEVSNDGRIFSAVIHNARENEKLRISWNIDCSLQ
jgi:hypothetical protein